MVAIQEDLVALGRLKPNVQMNPNLNAETDSSVYEGFYGELPVPATAYVTSTARLKSGPIAPSVRTVAANASVVDRHNDLDGMLFTGGRQMRLDPLPQYNRPVKSSAFQEFLIGPIVNYIQNNKWYIAYPAATAMLGGMHNMKWSEKVPQVPTRVTGGPGPAAMLAAPRFKAVQTVPRYSTMPSMYNTASAES
jgi:hypothetical protein